LLHDGQVPGSVGSVTGWWLLGDAGVLWLVATPAGAQSLYVTLRYAGRFTEARRLSTQLPPGTPLDGALAATDKAAILVADETYYALDVATEQLRLLQFVVRNVSPDQRLVAVSGPNAFSNNHPEDRYLAFYPLAQVGVPGAELARVEQVPNNTQVGPVHWDPAGTSAVVRSGNAGLEIWVDLRTGQLYPLPELPYSPYVQLSVDGQWLLRSSVQVSKTMELDDLNGNALHSLSFSAGSAQPSAVALAPRGDAIVVLTQPAAAAELPKLWLSPLPLAAFHELDTDSSRVQSATWLPWTKGMILSCADYNEAIFFPDSKPGPVEFVNDSQWSGKYHRSLIQP